MSLMLGYGESIGSLIVVAGGRPDESDVRGCVVFLRHVCVQQLSEANRAPGKTTRSVIPTQPPKNTTQPRTAGLLAVGLHSVAQRRAFGFPKCVAQIDLTCGFDV